MPLSDTDLADAFVRSKEALAWRRFGKHWELATYVRQHLAHYDWLQGSELTRTQWRVVKLLRTRMAKRAATTRKRNARDKRRAAEAARQGDLFAK